MADINDLISGILLRTSTHPDLTTKGSRLTHAEGDAVVVAFYEFLKDMVSGSSLTPYNAGTTYTGTMYVSYAGNIYVHISGTPTTGVTPGTNPAKWELSSVGALMHVRNQDTHLAYGTSDEVSAADLRVLLDTQYISVTTSRFETLISTSSFSENSIYAINDFPYSTGILLIKSFGAYTFSPHGVLLIRMPKLSSTSGIWNPAGTYAVNDYVIFSSEVYKNLTGSNSATTPPDSDGINWQIQDKTVSSKYEYQFFGVDFSFDDNSFFINTIYDRYFYNSNGNILGAIECFVPNGDARRNSCDIMSNFSGVCNFRGSVESNNLINSSISATHGGNVEGSGFTGNQLINSTIIYSEKNNAEFSGNLLEGVSLVFGSGHATTKVISNSRFEFAGQQTINLRSSASFTGKTINKDGSDVQDSISITGATTLNLTTNGLADVYGDILMTSSNSTETINLVSNGARIFPIKIRPNAGLTVTLTCTAYASISAHGQIIAPSGSYSLNGSKGDYVILEPVTVGSFNVYRVKSTSIVL